MKKSITNLCIGDDSTSTLKQDLTVAVAEPEHELSSKPATTTVTNANMATLPRTLEDMILQLELEEELSRKSKLDHHHHHHHHRQLLINQGRLSCFNNSDILQSARNAALNQYPRFSLDGKDAMYRSSFHHHHKGKPEEGNGNSVTWCKPGIVAKLMGLEAMPVNRKKVDYNYYSRKFSYNCGDGKEKMSSIMKKQSLRRWRNDLQLDVDDHGGYGGFRRGSTYVGSCSNGGGDVNEYCLMKRPTYYVKEMR